MRKAITKAWQWINQIFTFTHCIEISVLRFQHFLLSFLLFPSFSYSFLASRLDCILAPCSRNWDHPPSRGHTHHDVHAPIARQFRDSWRQRQIQWLPIILCDVYWMAWLVDIVVLMNEASVVPGCDVRLMLWRMIDACHWSRVGQSRSRRQCDIFWTHCQLGSSPFNGQSKNELKTEMAPVISSMHVLSLLSPFFSLLLSDVCTHSS